MCYLSQTEVTHLFISNFTSCCGKDEFFKTFRGNVKPSVAVRIAFSSGKINTAFYGFHFMMQNTYSKHDSFSSEHTIQVRCPVVKTIVLENDFWSKNTALVNISSIQFFL